MTKYPMKLVPYLRPMIWGGSTIKEKYNKETDSDSIGESWELTCRDEAQSVIANGEYAGQKLCDVLSCGYDFPLLIKFIDANDRLSVQVHPDDDITDENGTPLGKTEMWYIIDCDKDSHIIYGLEDGLTLEDYEKNVRNGEFSVGMKKVYVKPGDCYFIPAGQVHAIGKGILLAEIQQNSDTTYRLYDYGRLDKEGNPRELHVDKALSVIRAYTDSDIEAIRYSEGTQENCLANCSKFKCDKFILEGNSVTLKADSVFKSFVFIEGEGYISYNGERFPAVGGDTYYIPEGLTVEVSGNLTFLSANPK